MAANWNSQTITASTILVFLSLFGIRSLHVFAARNGLLEYFLSALDKKKLPSGLPLQVITTNGRFPKVDWQIMAPAVFMLNFNQNLAHPDTNLAGFLFLASWAPAWALIVLESFRKCNEGSLAAHILIPGLIIFNHSHAVGTPAYLALQLLFASSATSLSTNDLNVDQKHLTAIPFSFVFGYILPIIILALPAPNVVTWKFKHTVSGWYQQWSLFIGFFHYAHVYLIANSAYSQQQLAPSASSTLTSLRVIYGLAFMMAQLPHWVVFVISFTAWLCPSMFNEKKVKALEPSNVLVPTLPFTERKARDMAQGFMWLIQWDYLLGTLGMIVWSLVLHSNARDFYAPDDSWPYVALRFLGYLMLGGPAGLPVAIMWERDEWVFGSKTGLEASGFSKIK